jgi:hypothetical protein
MQLSHKLKKRIGWLLLLPILCLLVSGGTLYFLAAYQLSDSIRYIVKKESNGRLAFNASSATISIWNKSILLKNSVLYSNDTIHADRSFTVSIPTIFLSLSSWKELLLHKRVLVDSLSIIAPAIDIYARKILSHTPQDSANSRRDSAGFHASDIMTYLEKTLARFNVHSFSLKDASFSFETAGSPIPFQASHINISVSNFTGVNNEDSHLLGSDNVSILLGRQHWVLPDGKHEINFERMSFDSKGQRFELDSFSCFQSATAGKGTIHLRADQFFFNSRHLPAIYQKEQLLLDTVTCVNPVLSIPGNKSIPGNNREDSMQKTRFSANLFRFINIGYVAVMNGELRLENKAGLTAKKLTRKANVNIYNLSIDPAADPPLGTDSIRIDMKNTEFLTQDSLYRLSIGEFTFRGKDALFKNVHFEPARPGTQDKKVDIIAPSLLLKDISLVDLMRKHLKASAAELRQPLIILSGIIAPAPIVPASLSAATSAKKLALFYRTLHHVSELVNTRDFYVINGTARCQLNGPSPLVASIGQIDAHLLLNRFFISDSLVDFKQAIPDWRIGQLDLASKEITIRVRQYRFDGVKGLSQGQRVEVSTAGGMQFTGDNIYWNTLDWDSFQKDKAIRIDSLHADYLTVHIPARHPDTSPLTKSLPAAKTLPFFHMRRIGVNEIVIDGGMAANPFQCTVSNLQATGLRSVGRSFTWDHLSMIGHQLNLTAKKGTASIRELDFDSEGPTVVKDLRYQSKAGQNSTSISIPVLQLNAPIHSTELSQLDITSLSADRISLIYNKPTPKDTLQLHAEINILARNVLLFPHSLNLSTYDHLDLTWQNTTLRYRKDSMTLALDGIAGTFRSDTSQWSQSSQWSRWSPGMKPDWAQLTAATSITRGSFHYKGKSTIARAAECTWTPAGRILSLRHFNVLPIETRETAFGKTKWQNDYITIKGEALTLSGIGFSYPGDSSVSIHQVIATGIIATASRDRSMPFHHGVPRLMPTKLIDAIPIPIRIDTLLVQNSTVIYEERSAATHKWSSVPIEEIDGRLLQIGNRNNHKDTLALVASAKIFGGRIRRFSYRESYGDSLSAFSARASFSSIDLTRFSQVSIPAAGVSVISGHADTLYSNWQGNNYATFGTMNFYYDKLRIRVLDKKDSTKRGFLATLKTLGANIILPDRRQRSSAIFFERDREKFVFNYWIKAQTSGILSTVGLKRSAAYMKDYGKIYKQYSLPAVPPQ